MSHFSGESETCDPLFPQRRPLARRHVRPHRTFFQGQPWAHNRLEAMSTLKIEDSTNINDDSHLIKIYNPIDYHPYLYSLIKNP